MRAVGDLQIAVVNDGFLGLTNRMLFHDAPDELIDPFTDKHANGTIRFPMSSVVIRDGNRTLLVDTGLATRSTIRMSGGGALLDGLQKLNVTPESVTDVVLTHAHGDHIGWNTVPGAETPKLTFPNARYWLHERDWAHFTGSEVVDTSPLYRECLLPLKSLGALELFTTDTDITASVRMQLAPGQSPGHCCVLLSSGTDSALVLGDITHHPIDFLHPEWNCQFDVDFGLTRHTRRKILDQAATDSILLISYHHPQPYGRAIHHDGAFRWVDEE